MDASRSSRFLMPLIALLIAAMMMVVACGGDGDDGDSGSGAAAPVTDASTTTTTTTTDTSTTTAAEPATTTTEPAAMMEPVVNRVVTAFEAPSTEGNETRHIGQTTVWQMKPMYEYLIDSHPITDEMLPGLALEWAVEEGPEGPQVRFHLREGVQFHDDWGEFTAADVVHTMENHQREGGLHGELVYFQDVTYETYAENDYEVVFKLSRPDSNFFAQISRLQGGVEIISKAHHDAEGDPVVIGEDAPIAGTGSYQYLERAQGQNIVSSGRPTTGA